jgi:hypothetical protein
MTFCDIFNAIARIEFEFMKPYAMSRTLLIKLSFKYW